MIMHMRHHLTRRCAIILHDIPIPDACDFSESLGEEGEVEAEFARFGGGDVGYFGPVGARCEEQVAGGEGEDV